MSKKTCADCIHCQMCRWIDDMVKNSTCDFFEEWGCRPHGMWKIDGTDYADGKVTAIYISHEFHGLDYAKFVPERPHGEWIPCSERLPEESGQYYVSGGDKVWICSFLIIPTFKGGWCNNASNPVVEAWMPLPEPYKKEGEAE